MINIAELLKNASKGLELYSPICGHCKLSCILYNDCIRVIAHDAPFRFDKYGRFCSADNAECLLFPSKDCRTWEGWKLPSKSKFKVGDWIVQNDNGTISQITKIINGKDEHGEYHAYEHTNGYFAACFEDEFHLWTIQDAGNGDVLANTAGCILIVKDNESCLCYIDKNGEFHANNNRWFFANFSDNALMPATKKQRGQLFAKMKEAGYTWDADKKELRKTIKPKFKVGDEVVWAEQKGDKPAEPVKIMHLIDKDQLYMVDMPNGVSYISYDMQDYYKLVQKSQHYDISNFHAGMPVLVRETNLNAWQYVHFSHCYVGGDGLTRFNAGLVGFTQCIPFEGNEHLLGTTDMPSEEYINW